MPRILALIFLAGLLLGVAGTIVVPRVAGPYLPAGFGGPEDVEGRVSGKLREDGRLLLTVETDRGNVLATFTQRVPEIDLLVAVGDTLVMAMPEYSPFVEDPDLAKVASPPGGQPPAGGPARPGESEAPSPLVAPRPGRASEPTPDDGEEPGAVTTRFYAGYLTLRVQGIQGIPDAGARTTLAPFFTPSLNQLLIDAASAEARYAAAQSEPVPPLLEADPFTSLFEGATGVIGQPDCRLNGRPRAAACTVLLEFDRGTAGDGEPTRWHDITHLVELPLDGRTVWRVDDIEFGGDWPFANQGRLTDLLHAVIAEAPPAG